jgi:hypothetical protein
VSKLMPNSEQNINILQCRTICLNFSIHLYTSAIQGAL